ncbi:Rho termination factor N-terminal domain-containing protein [Rothia nasimurium]|uniref:Rho termination factor N-terminal domain-containing protein n=1 Tax=Rothia nasimurium TaxID=85336 RepID=UPI002DD65C76|nr:Rho termination factor N-terminal domain-containing protein [Rothia nasimurium]
MGKKLELSKELKRSSDKAQKRYVKAYAKALDKHGDEKKARKKAQKRLEKKYELVGKKYKKITDKPQAAPKGKGAAALSAGKGKKGSEKVKAEKTADQKKSDKKDSKKKAKNNKKSAAQREAELILADVTEGGEETAGYEEILDAESLEPGDLEAFEGEEEAPDLQSDDQTFLVAEVRPLAELTRAELYELAKQLEVPGRSSMNKGDLLIAVRAAQ